MKRTTLVLINILLGAVISFFMGCKTHRVNKSQPQPEADAREQLEPQPERMICLYGIPPEVYKRLHEQDSLYQDSIQKAQADSLTRSL